MEMRVEGCDRGSPLEVEKLPTHLFFIRNSFQYITEGQYLSLLDFKKLDLRKIFKPSPIRTQGLHFSIKFLNPIKH